MFHALLRRHWPRLVRFMTRPMFGTRVIPRNARVDPDVFSEDEFPLWCGQCNYLLRGLPDGRCPECGTPFEKSHLLVQQYVRDPLGRLWRHDRLGRLFVRLVVVGFGSIGGTFIAMWIYAACMAHFANIKSIPARIVPDLLQAGAIVVWLLQVAVTAGLAVCAAAAVARVKRIMRKRRCVIEAMTACEAGQSPRT